MRKQRHGWCVPVGAILALTLALVLGGCGPWPPDQGGDSAGRPREEAPGGGDARGGAAASGSYLFCFWNTENFFDDKVDQRRAVDKVYDTWFGEHPEVLQRKLDNLTSVLLKMNDGRGPDILAIAEAESKRSAELLKDALNKRLPRGTEPYRHVLMEEINGGRHIATAIITRLPVETDRTQLLNKRLRILEGHIRVKDQDLTVIASHWTSRVSSKENEEGSGRYKYADLIYGRFRAMYTRNPEVAFLVCGDFNDTPDDESVTKYLHGSSDVALVRREAKQKVEEPHLLDLLMGKDLETFGTHSYRNKWFIFDQILVSPGMLTGTGWSADVESVQTVKTSADRRGRPWDFGDPQDKIPLNERGYSDHFPVTVRLRVR